MPLRCFVTALLLILSSAAAAQTVTLTADSNSGHDAVWVKRYAAGVNSWGITGNHIPGTNGDIWFNSFPGASGDYTIELGAVLEPDGNSQYRLFVASTKVAEGNYPYSTGAQDCSASTLKTQYLPLGTHTVNQGDKITLWGEAVYPCGTDHGQYTRWYELRFTKVGSSSGTPPQILSPAPNTPLQEGSSVTLKGSGSGTLTWTYDANSDGLGAITIGTGAQVSFTVPTGVKAPKTLKLTLTGDAGSVDQNHPISSASTPADAGTPATDSAPAADSGAAAADSAPPAPALPAGYLVWSKGKQGDSGSRKIYRMTLPGKTDIKALTSGEDIGCQVSYDGKWVAYAKAKLSGGSDYHAFGAWQVYLVHIDGVSAGHGEVKIDDGYWPSWGKDNTLYYSVPDGKHTKIMKVTIDAQGQPGPKSQVIATASAFASYQEINECFVAPDGRWFAGRTRGNAAYTGVGAYLIAPPKWELLGKAGSVGCMPYVAPDSSWGFNAGSGHGIRWGHAPDVPNRKQDQTLIPAQSGKSCYHPGISTDGKWVMTGQSSSSDQNAGPWDIYIYRLDASTMQVADETLLLSGGFNGWPHIWVDPGATPPPADAGPPVLTEAGVPVSPDAAITFTEAGVPVIPDAGQLPVDEAGLPLDPGEGGLSGGCGCRLQLPGSGGGSAGALALLALLLGLARRRRN